MNSDFDNLIYPSKYLQNYLNRIEKMNKIHTLMNNQLHNSNYLLKKLYYNPLQKLIEHEKKSKQLRDEIDRRCKFIDSIAFENKWFPTAFHFDFPIYYMYENLHKLKDNNCKKATFDEIVIEYYTDKILLDKLKSIKEQNISDFHKRVIEESFEAYINKKFALCIFSLISIWEGIIKNKYKIDVNRRNYKKALQNNIENFVSKELDYKFFDEYVFISPEKDINKIDNDIPQRNVVAHSYLTEYPSQKQALNAILITEFLSNLIDINAPNYDGIDDILTLNN